jgi:hypothetical protein
LSTEEVSAAGIAIVVSDGGLKLRAVDERVSTVTNTRRVIIALVVVGEGTPLGTGIDNTISQDQSTGSTDHVTIRELLDKVWRNLLAVLADECHVQVLAPCFCSALLDAIIAWCDHLWGVRLWPINIIELVENETLALLATKLLSLV